MAEGSSGNAGFVDHLRLVHLTLIATCLIGMAAITSASPSAIGQAYEEGVQLLNLAQRWQGGDWMKKALADKRSAMASVSTPAPNGAIHYTLAEPGGPARTVSIVPPQPSNTRGASLARQDNGTTDWFLLATRLGAGGTSLTSKQSETTFETLQDAQKIWHLLDRFRYAVALKDVGDGWWISDDGEVRELKRMQDTDTTVKTSATPNGRLRLYLREDYLKTLHPKTDKWDLAANTLLETDKSNCYIVQQGYLIRAGCVAEPIFLQALLLKESPLGSQLVPGEFSQSFPSLDEVAKHLTGLSLNDLQTYLAAEKIRSGEKIELLGAKLPSDSITNWGIAVLSALVAYFFAVFRDFANRVRSDDPAWNVP